MTLALESYDGDDGVGVDEDDEGVRPERGRSERHGKVGVLLTCPLYST